jgi:hypothetical protein
VIAWHDDWQVMQDGTRRAVRTIQGVGHRSKCQFGVQFHPEVSVGFGLSCIGGNAGRLMDWLGGGNRIVHCFVIRFSTITLIPPQSPRIPSKTSVLPVFDTQNLAYELDVSISGRESGGFESRVEDGFSGA